MDCATYIGLPFLEKGRDRTGVDCWGLVAMLLREQFGLEVPSYTEDYTTTKEGEEIAALIGRESLDWPEVPLAEAQPGDVLILRIKGQPWHCGLVVEPPCFIHAALGVGTVRERWDALLWSRRIVAVHRHPELARRSIDAHTLAGAL